MAGMDIAEPLVAAEAFLGATPAGWARPGAFAATRGRRRIRIAKYVLPILGLALLSSIAMWPEIARNFDHTRVVWRQAARIASATGQMLHPRYHGMDEKQRPYTLSAETAERVGPLRVNLAAPVGDMTLANGTWMMLRAKTGVFIQHSNELDLAQDVLLYRQDGTMMISATATMNLSQGAAASNEYTHAEGPFGTLDAEGFTMVDKGTVVQFRGPAKLVLNGAH